MFIISSAILIRMTAAYCHDIFLVSGRCKTLARLNGNQTMQSDWSFQNQNNMLQATPRTPLLHRSTIIDSIRDKSDWCIQLVSCSNPWMGDVLCCVMSDFKDRFKIQSESSGRESVSGVGKNVHISQMKLVKIEVRDSRNFWQLKRNDTCHQMVGNMSAKPPSQTVTKITNTYRIYSPNLE